MFSIAWLMVVLILLGGTVFKEKSIFYQIKPCLLSCFSRDGIQTQNSLRRSVYVPVISLKKCTSYYKDHDYEITSDNICTLDPLGKKGCSHEDGGSALVLSEELVGVLIFAGSNVGQCRPDIFIRINNNNTYNQWIKSNIALHLNNRVRSPHLHNILPQTAHN